tara:strand:+ start:2789 stop:3004 length:216 start_codon:yes stop_codon:yes gene_type:complete
MFVPLPPVGRFTEGLLIVSEDVPDLFALVPFFFLLLTSSARGVGGGGAIGAGWLIIAGDGILGLDRHMSFS